MLHGETVKTNTVGYKVRKQKLNTLTITGESTLCTLLSSTKISRALAQRAFTSLSLIISHRFNCSICLSKSLVSFILAHCL